VLRMKFSAPLVERAVVGIRRTAPICLMGFFSKTGGDKGELSIFPCYAFAL
jgi:hypothetical protein